MCEYHQNDIIGMLSKYLVKPILDLEDLNQLLQRSSSHLGVGVRNYLDFLAYKGHFSQEMVVVYKSIIRSRSISPDLFIPTDEMVKDAYLKLDEQRFQTLYKILAYSGIRITELVELISKYEPERLIINENVAKYPLGFIRGKKQSFYVYLPKEVASELKHFRISIRSIVYKFGEAGLSGKYLRKWFYNFLIYNNVPESVADFMEGGATQTVGSMHYLSRVKQADYWYEKIVKKLDEVL